ncbi:MAG: hypothetical protein AAGF67_06700 [Verrucomicrobiota bacterium]
MKSASLIGCFRTFVQLFVPGPVLNAVVATAFAFGIGSVLADDEAPGSPFQFGFLPTVTEPIQQPVGREERVVTTTTSPGIIFGGGPPPLGP